MSQFLDALRSGRVRLMDGAMGTELQRAGLRPGEYGEVWNFTHPERVRKVHQSYRDAGAEVLLTNTLMVNGDVHALYRQLGGTVEYNRLWEAAYELAGPGGFVLADVGPVAGPSFGRDFDNLAYVVFSSLIFDDADGILLETCSSPRVRYALQRLRSRHVGAGKPLLLSLTYWRDPARGIVSASGHAPEWFAERAEKWGASALGVNCGRDMTVGDCAEVVRRYRAVTGLPLFAKPN